MVFIVKLVRKLLSYKGNDTVLYVHILLITTAVGKKNS